ncbi:MAG TPA: sulfatase-like hydrolase/transferase [Phycisphaerae bacterium]|nr:sulfatase-like hydrolase/transferase [Phycisphaerae bacterium]
MKRRDFLKATAGGIAAMGWLPSLALSGTGGRKPNVVILFIDDLGYGDLGSFGCRDIPTPHMDSLATNGVKCTNSYITNPPCSPSRCCLMTGMYTQRFGKSGMARGLPIPKGHPTLGEFMRDAGHVTGMIGKWDIGCWDQGPLDRGFMEVARSAPAKKPFICLRPDGSEVFRTDLDGDYMAEFVEQNRDKPFFLYFSPNAVHSPSGDTPARYQKRSKATGKRKALAGAIIAVDDAVGKLLAMLKKHNLRENTLIFLTGDNGPNPAEEGSAEPYRGGKGGGTQLEGWVHTPAIISWPGHLPAGKTYDGLMCTMDFYATAAAVAEKPLPERCEGKNLLPYLRGEKTGDAHEVLYWHNVDPKDAERRRLLAMRWKQWRLVEYPDGWRLFDLKADPKETHDLAAAHPDVAAAMRKRLDAWAAQLPPPDTSWMKDGRGGRMPQGWGWATDADAEEWKGQKKARS